MPFRNVIKAWKDFGGVKMASESNTQLGPVTTVDKITSVAFDEADGRQDVRPAQARRARAVQGRQAAQAHQAEVN